MKTNTKAKWVVGVSGVAFSAFIIGQLDTSVANNNGLAVEITENMSEREKELLSLDWSDFSIQTSNEGMRDSDRTSRKSKKD